MSPKDLQSQVQAADIPTSGSLSMQMGQAYDMDRNKILNLACAVGNPVTIQTGNTSANVNVDYNLSYEKLYNKIQGGGSLDVSFSAVKAGVQVDAALEFAQNPAHQSVRDAVERILLDSSYLQQKSTPDLMAMASDRIELFKEIVRTDPEWAKALLEKIPAGSTHRKVLENHVGYLSSVGVFRAER